MTLITRRQYDMLVFAPDEWEPVSFARGGVQRRSLQARGLIEVNGRQWKITPAGLDMVRRFYEVEKVSSGNPNGTPFWRWTERKPE